MAFSDSNRGSIRFQRELAFNTKPTPFNAQELRITSSSLAAEKQTQVSDELRSDRMVSDNIETGFTSGGQVGFELSLGGTFDNLLEAALGGAWSTPVNFTGAVTVAAGAKTLGAAGAFTNASVGQWIFLNGMTNAANNGWHKITAKASADQVTVSTTTLVNETSAGTAKIKGKQCKNGVNAYSYALEQGFNDISVYQLFLGQRVSQMGLEVKASSKVTGNFQFMGAAVQVGDVAFTAAVTPATSTSVINATSNIGKITSGGVDLQGNVQGVSLQLNNNLRNQMAVGSKYPVGIGYGRQQVSGTLTVYFQDKALYEKFLQHEYISIGFGFQDAAGNALFIELPKVSLSKNAPAPTGIDQDVMQAVDFVAVADATSGAQIILSVA